MKTESWPSPQEQFLQYTQEIIGDYIKEKIEKASDTDSIFGEIYGTVKTVPTKDFKISFDTNKNDFESVVQSLLMEKFNTMNIDSDTKFVTLKANVSISSESEKDKPTEERNSGGGLRTLV